MTEIATKTEQTKPFPRFFVFDCKNNLTGWGDGANLETSAGDVIRDRPRPIRVKSQKKDKKMKAYTAEEIVCHMSLETLKTLVYEGADFIELDAWDGSNFATTVYSGNYPYGPALKCVDHDDLVGDDDDLKAAIAKADEEFDPVFCSATWDELIAVARARLHLLEAEELESTPTLYELSKFSRRHSGQWYHVCQIPGEVFQSIEEAIEAAESATSGLYPEGVPTLTTDFTEAVFATVVGSTVPLS